ncbi:hypothetical protein [Halomonas sp.]|uniref:hypothetical protein n=1 Tax=Halomonas sp. TaxID=1486246 RepID=UPI00356B2A2B
MQNEPEVSADDVPSLDSLTGERINEIITDVEIETPDGEKTPLGAVAADIVEAHTEVEAYKNGSMALSQALNEALTEYDEDDDEMVAQVIEELRAEAFGVYLRVTRGDDELIGDRDGPYSDYFGESEPDEASR